MWCKYPSFQIQCAPLHNGKRKDAEGAWLAYRVLIGHLKTAMVKYHRGLKFDEEAGGGGAMCILRIHAARVRST